MKRRWTLDAQQRVCADRHVYFKHDGRYRTITLCLSYRQFLNLNDIIMDLNTLHKLKCYPLGQHLWLEVRQHRIQLYHYKSRKAFIFHTRSWHTYLNDIHPQLRSFFRHASSALHDRQHVPSDETLHERQLGRTPSSPARQPTVSRETSNVTDTNEQQASPANLCQRNSTDTRRPFSFIGAIHALRTVDSPSPRMETPMSDVELNCGQFSDLCTIE